jgi:hypothetical protein
MNTDEAIKAVSEEAVSAAQALELLKSGFETIGEISLDKSIKQLNEDLEEAQGKLSELQTAEITGMAAGAGIDIVSLVSRLFGKEADNESQAQGVIDKQKSDIKEQIRLLEEKLATAVANRNELEAERSRLKAIELFYENRQKLAEEIAEREAGVAEIIEKQKEEADKLADKRKKIADIADAELLRLRGQNTLLQLQLQFGKDSQVAKEQEISNEVNLYKQRLLGKDIAEETVEQLGDQYRISLRLTDQLKDQVQQAREFKRQVKEVSKTYTEMLEKRVLADVFDPRGEEGTTATQALRLGFNPFADDDKDKTKTKRDPLAEMLKEVRHKTKLLDLTEEEIRAEEIRYQLEKAGVKNTDDRIDKLIKESEAYYKLNEERDKQKVRIDEIGNAFSNMLMDIVDGTAKADEAFKSFMSSVLKQLFQETAIDPAVSFLKSFLLADGGVMSRGKLTPFAYGGVVNGPTVFPMANGMGLMGEAGPEAIMPLKRGPNGKLGVEGGGGVTVVQNINVSTGVQQTVRTEIKSLMPQIAEASKAAVADAKRRGGSYGRNFS